MSRGSAGKPEYRWREVLRKAGIALQGHAVGVWEADERGQLLPVAASGEQDIPEKAAGELETALREWNVDRPAGRRWVASQLEAGRWCIAPVRYEPAGPPPVGVERRGRERMTLELAALGIGLIERPAAAPAPRTANDVLRDSQARLALLIEQVPAIVWTTDHELRVTSRSGGLRSLDVLPERVPGVSLPEQHRSRTVTAESLEAHRRALEGESVSYAIRGGERCFDAHVEPLRSGAGAIVGVVGIALDVSDRERAAQQLLHGALHDSLTDLPNRVFFIERVGQALERERRDPGYRFAVVVLDFDDFKLVNDSLGHAAGDRLLALIAGRLRTCVRPGDVVARLGGDEFALLLEFVATPTDAEHATRRIQRSLTTPFEIHGRGVYASASIGVALSSAGYEHAEDTLRDADIAMYRAKARGRANFQVFDVAMRDRQAARLSLETDLRNALERGELRIVFQPVVELASGRVHGFEALLRWQHPERGTIQPLEFIPLAEQTGLIVPIGSWVLHEACWYAGRWQRAYARTAPIRISVNLSAKQLGHPRLVEEVRGSLGEAGLDPRCLGLEITESVLVENLESAAAMLEELRRLDVELQMDDFGTGYSSLSYLPHFPLQVIKIDRSFVRRMGTRHADLEVVRSIVELARNLGMGVIAEGVETAEQREQLLGFGCTLGQGFHFAEALDPVAAGALLEAALKKEPT